MPVSLMHMKATEIGSGVVGTIASGYSGLEVAGTVGGLVGSMCAVVAIVTSVTAGNAKRRRQYDDDIRAAELRGRRQADVETARERDERQQAERERDDYRDRYLNLLERGGPPNL